MHCWPAPFQRLDYEPFIAKQHQDLQFTHHFSGASAPNHPFLKMTSSRHLWRFSVVLAIIWFFRNKHPKSQLLGKNSSICTKTSQVINENFQGFLPLQKCPAWPKDQPMKRCNDVKKIIFLPNIPTQPQNISLPLLKTHWMIMSHQMNLTQPFVNCMAIHGLIPVSPSFHSPPPTQSQVPHLYRKGLDATETAFAMCIHIQVPLKSWLSA